MRSSSPCRSLDYSADTAKQIADLLERSIGRLRDLKQIHARLLKSGLETDQHILSRLLFAVVSSESSSLCYVQSIFSCTRRRNLFMWNTLARAYSQSDNPLLAIYFYVDMLKEGFRGNNFTFPSVIKACALCDHTGKLGRQVHAHVVISGVNNSDVFVRSALIRMYSLGVDMAAARKLFDASPQKDVVLWTTMVDGYCRNDEICTARQLFDEMPERNVVSWSAMIAGYVKADMFLEALGLFQEMQLVGLIPNESVIVSVLSTCAHLGALAQGRWVHSYIASINMELNVFIETALIDMYSKCGCINQALLVFEGMANKDVKSWNCIITALATNGNARRSLEFFCDMQNSGVQPNDVTFIAVLSGCAHAGLVLEGFHCFDLMVFEYHIDPKPEHYACMVDLLGRAGHLDEAEKFAEASAQSEISIWGALLGACRIYGNVEMGDRVWKRMIQMGMNDCGSHILLYNLYKASGWLSDATIIRKTVNDKGLLKVPACSTIEVNGKVESFLSGNSSHPRFTDIEEMLEILIRTFTMEGSRTATLPVP